MDTLSQLLVLAIGMTVLVESSKGSDMDSSQNVACMDAISCMPDSDKLMAAIQNSNYNEACQIVTKSHTCMKSAVDDCKANNIITGEALQSMEGSLNAYESQLTQYCQNPTSDVSCMDGTSCIPDTDKLIEATQNGNTEETCRILTTSTTCLQKAVDDCKARGVMSEEQVKQMEDLKKSYQPQIEQMCASTSSQGVSCFQMLTCAPDMTKLNKSLENQQFQEACAIMKPAIQCQRSAMEDCKKRGVYDSSTLQEMEQGAKTASAEMEKYCSSGNSASPSMFAIFLAAVWVFLTKFMRFRM